MKNRLLEEGDNELDVFEVALKNLGGAKITIAEEDADLIFDIVAYKCSTVNGTMSTIRWLDFFTALKLVAKKQNRKVYNVIQDATFAHVGDQFRAGWLDLCAHGVKRRLRGVFLAFTGNDSFMQRDHFLRLCEDCDLLDPPKFSRNHAEVVFKGAWQHYKSLNTPELLKNNVKQALKLPFHYFLPLLERLAKERKTSPQDLIGQVAWSFGPKLHLDSNFTHGDRLC